MFDCSKFEAGASNLVCSGGGSDCLNELLQEELKY